MMRITVRDYEPAKDADGIRACTIELQDFERRLDPRMPRGEEIVDDYLIQLVGRCAKYAGKVIVAEVNQDIAGFISVWTRVPSEEMDEGEFEYGYVSDLVVRRSSRGHGLGRALLEAAEAYARDSGARWLRIGVLAENSGARALYRACGFDDYSIELEKALNRD